MPSKTKAPDLSRAVALYREGYGFAAIAPMVGAHASTVRRFLIGQGVTIRRVGAIPLEHRPIAKYVAASDGARDKANERMFAAQRKAREDAKAAKAAKRKPTIRLTLPRSITAADRRKLYAATDKAIRAMGQKPPKRPARAAKESGLAAAARSVRSVREALQARAERYEPTPKRAR